MESILIVEDNISLANELSEMLNKNEYICYISPGDNYRDLIEKNNIDLILLDINLPFESGFEICNYIKSKYDIPIIMLTGRITDIDEITGLSLGADDYIKKPYHFGVLLARIKKILEGKREVSVMKYKNIIFDTRKNTVKSNGREIILTMTESLILYYLLKRPSEIISRTELIEFLWDNASFIDDNTLSVNVSRIRKKLEGVGIVDFIITKPKQGYMI